MLKTIFHLVLAAMLGVLTTTSHPAQASGSVAPSFTLRDINGAEVSLSDYKGTVVLLISVPPGADPAGRKCQA